MLNLNDIASNKRLSGLIDKCFEMRTISHRQTLGFIYEPET